MHKELSADETELLSLTDSTLKKLSAMTDENYGKLELYPRFRRVKWANVEKCVFEHLESLEKCAKTAFKIQKKCAIL